MKRGEKQLVLRSKVFIEREGVLLLIIQEGFVYHD